MNLKYLLGKEEGISDLMKLLYLYLLLVLSIFVRMNTYILDVKRAKATKVADNMYFYSTQNNYD